MSNVSCEKRTRWHSTLQVAAALCRSLIYVPRLRQKLGRDGILRENIHDVRGIINFRGKQFFISRSMVTNIFIKKVSYTVAWFYI